MEGHYVTSDDDDDYGIPANSWGGQELQQADGWLTNSAGESAEIDHEPTTAEDHGATGDDALTLKDKKARRCDTIKVPWCA